MLEWIQSNETLAWWLAAISLVTFLATLVAVPFAIVKLPADYFATENHKQFLGADRHPVLRALWRVGKSLVGVTLIIMGVLMLVLPGQGIITIVVGLMLLRFPGKFQLQRWIVSRRSVLRSLNWVRRRYGRQPLVLHT